MRKLELIRALLGLEQAHAAIVEDRHRVSVVVFESPVDRRLAIDDGYFIAYCLCVIRRIWSAFPSMPHSLLQSDH